MQTMMDLLSSGLRSLRIQGAFLLRESYESPWALTIPASHQLKPLLRQGRETHLVAFHFVEKGCCALQLTSDCQETKVTLETGEIAICFSGQEHRLVHGEASASVSLASLLEGGGEVSKPRQPCSENSLSLLCGVFVLHDTRLSPLFQALPVLLKTSLTTPGYKDSLAGLIPLMRQELEQSTLGSTFVLERMLEIVCAETIRTYALTLPEEKANWLRGMTDPVAGPALTSLHRDPAQNWTVAQLAQTAAMSPSRFAARFLAAVGESPIKYLTRWRMNVAARLLSDSPLEIAQIAAEVGYENLPAFYRTFKKYLGMPPAQWKSSRKG